MIIEIQKKVKEAMIELRKIQNSQEATKAADKLDLALSEIAKIPDDTPPQNEGSETAQSGKSEGIVEGVVIDKNGVHGSGKVHSEIKKRLGLTKASEDDSENESGHDDGVPEAHEGGGSPKDDAKYGLKPAK